MLLTRWRLNNPAQAKVCTVVHGAFSPLLADVGNFKDEIATSMAKPETETETPGKPAAIYPACTHRLSGTVQTNAAPMQHTPGIDRWNSV